MTQYKVAAIDDISEGELKAVTVAGTELVLAMVDSRLYAVSAHCPHHHAPLADGLLNGKRLVCPWHQAVFDVADGEVLEPPPLSCLESFPVTVEGDQIHVELPTDPATEREPEMAATDLSTDGGVFVVIGAGAAGMAAAQELRRAGYRGRLVVVDRDERAPYDRTNCSKDYLAGEAEDEWMPLKPPDFFSRHRIELVRGTVSEFDVSTRKLLQPGGTSLNAERVLLATGGRPRNLDVDGEQLDGIFTLRSWTDADRIAAEADRAARIVVVGASFIAMESASALRRRGVESVTAVAPESVPFENTLGPEVGSVLRSVHEEHGVAFRLGRQITGFSGTGKVERVHLDDGSDLEADLVLVGIGVEPVTDFVRGADRAPDGSLVTDSTLKVADGVYAAGDIASFPDPWSDELIRIEHWRLALQHGQAAARNMAGRDVRFDRVPFFWTVQHGIPLGHVGHAPRWDEVIVHGNLDERDFLALYVRDDQVRAAATIGRSRQLNALHELLAEGRVIPADEVRDSEPDLSSRLS